MNPDYYFLPLALLLLWTPAVLVSSAEVRAKLRQQVRRYDDGFTSLIRNWVNWADLGRSAGGAWMLQRTITAFSVGQDDLTTSIMCVQLAVLFIGVLIQTIWFSQRPLIIGPTFYLIGLTLAVCGPKVGCFGLVLGYTCALMLRRLSLSFLFVPTSLTAFALLFHRFGLMTIFSAAAFALPLLLAFALGERIAYARRPGKSQRIGYVYGGTYIQEQDVALEKDIMIPAKEDVPCGNFAGPNAHAEAKLNGRLSNTPVLPRFSAQDQSPPAAKQTSASSSVR